MTITIELKYETGNPLISQILIEDKINIILPDDSNIFEYINYDNKNKTIVVEFKYNESIVSQAFYQCGKEFNGTWLPFDGIKANINDGNLFYKYFDIEPFRNKIFPFGNKKLMAVSYILGGGVWVSRDTKFRDILNVEERISYLNNLSSVNVDFQDSLYINHYINYAISRNYYEDHPSNNKFYKPKSPVWIKVKNSNLNEQKLFSAFDFSYKMNNSNQIEYTPPVFLDKTKREDYEDFYKKIDNSQIKEYKVESFRCTIL